MGTVFPLPLGSRPRPSYPIAYTYRGVSVEGSPPPLVRFLPCFLSLEGIITSFVRILPFLSVELPCYLTL